MALLASAAFTGCQADMDAPEMETPVATMAANTTIADFKTAFANEDAKVVPLKDDGNPYIIHGRVVSSDASGNIYKSLVIQDETAALAISLNQSSTYVEYRIGQDVVMNVTGLYMGKYRGLQQLGWLGTPYDGTPQLGFMAYDLFLGHSEKNGLPDQEIRYVGLKDQWPADKAYCVVTSIGELPSSGELFRNVTSQLVELRNVSFVDGGKETFAPYQESVSRYIKDAAGNQMIVRNSGYSTFYNDTLPEGTGTVRGILSYYGSEWQLLLRTKADVIFKSKGQQKDPYTVEEAIAEQNNGTSGWMKGYIVGSVKGGVQNVTSNADIIFGADAELDNNLVIGPSASCTDYTQCVAINLPQGSSLRKYGNLIDNPSVLGKEISLTGMFATYLGMAGVTGNNGTTSEFTIEGVDTDKPVTPPASEGDGSKEKPFTVAQVMSSSKDATGVWIEGYVVGYVADMKWQETAVFGNQPTEGSTNYANGTNCILSDSPAGEANLNNSVPTGLGYAVRDALGISKNPAIYGQKVRVKGDVTKYFGVRGIKNVSEYEIVGGGGDKPNPPTPPAGDGDGTENNPFSVAQVMASSSDTTGAWIEGYVVGYVADMKWQESAVFGNQPTEGSNNYTNATNCILSDKPAGSAALDNSIPAGIKAGETRDILGISKNPSIYGKKVRVQGDVTKYFGVRAVKNISKVTILD